MSQSDLMSWLFIVLIGANVITYIWLTYEIYESWRVSRGWARIRRDEIMRRKKLNLPPRESAI